MLTPEQEKRLLDAWYKTLEKVGKIITMNTSQDKIDNWRVCADVIGNCESVKSKYYIHKYKGVNQKMKLLICLKNGHVIKDDMPIESLLEIKNYIRYSNWLYTGKSLINVDEISFIVYDVIKGDETE